VSTDFEDLENDIDLSAEFRGIKASNARWFTAHGILIDIDRTLKGAGICGICTLAGDIRGASVSGIYNGAGELHGFSAGAVNVFHENQTGLSIGLVNFAEELSGIQIGIFNIARNNPGWARYLPFINARF
jgi:hypothetical protein